MNHSAIEESQAGSHQEYQRGGYKYPGDISGTVFTSIVKIRKYRREDGGNGQRDK